MLRVGKVWLVGAFSLLAVAACSSDEGKRTAHDDAAAGGEGGSGVGEGGSGVGGSGVGEGGSGVGGLGGVGTGLGGVGGDGSDGGSAVGGDGSEGGGDAAGAGGQTASLVNLLINGDFELPAASSGSTSACVTTGCLGFNVGDMLEGWKIVGAGPIEAGAPVVALVTSDYSENSAGTGPGPLHFLAEHGNQFVDLTGRGNQGVNGIEQTVSTTAGMLYSLSFFVGNADDAFPLYSLPSSVELSIDGTVIATDSNESVTSDTMNWKQFTHVFTAGGPTTTIRLLNRTPSGDNVAGVDNATLIASP